jgi:hypothetical protein
LTERGHDAIKCANAHRSITTGAIKARLSLGWLKKADRFPSNSPDRRKLAKCIGPPSRLAESNSLPDPNHHQTEISRICDASIGCARLFRLEGPPLWPKRICSWFTAI